MTIWYSLEKLVDYRCPHCAVTPHYENGAMVYRSNFSIGDGPTEGSISCPFCGNTYEIKEVLNIRGEDRNEFMLATVFSLYHCHHDECGKWWTVEDELPETLICCGKREVPQPIPPKTFVSHP